jgi:hypothetical protein
MVRTPDFLAIGHVTKDLLPGGGYTMGGTVTYAALTARNLGVSTAVLTSAPRDLDVSSNLEGVQIHVVPAECATTFSNIYEDGKRRQYLHGMATPLEAVHLPPAWKTSPIVLLGPLAGELGLGWLGVFPAAVVGVTPQGWMRQWNGNGTVTAKPWQEAEQILPRVDVLVLSEEDVGQDEALIRRYASLVRIAVVTRGCGGATVFCCGVGRSFPAFRAQEVDPTGAGDVFAAAFLVRLRETGDAYAAAAFANCTASFAVEGSGTTTIPTRQQVEERLRSGRFCY